VPPLTLPISGVSSSGAGVSTCPVTASSVCAPGSTVPPVCSGACWPQAAMVSSIIKAISMAASFFIRLLLL
jgi:hypothetical protein